MLSQRRSPTHFHRRSLTLRAHTVRTTPIDLDLRDDLLLQMSRRSHSLLVPRPPHSLQHTFGAPCFCSCMPFSNRKERQFGFTSSGAFGIPDERQQQQHPRRCRGWGSVYQPWRNCATRRRWKVCVSHILKFYSPHFSCWVWMKTCRRTLCT